MKQSEEFESNVIILGNEEDESIYEIIQYLLINNIQAVHIKDTDELTYSAIRINNEGDNFVIVFGDYVVRSERILSYYYRRSNICLQSQVIRNDYPEFQSSILNAALRTEYDSFRLLLHTLLERAPVKAGAFARSNWDKQSQLLEATRCGLRIPNTYILQTKSDVQKLFEKHEQVATKAIKNGVMGTLERGVEAGMYTNLFSAAELEEIPENFAPTLFQEYIEKKYEVRIFYFQEEFYPIAIFSQANEETKVDFRARRFGLPSRSVPFFLPEEIKEKLSRMMVNIKMDTGSIDMIVGPDNNYYFLEVNPDGQYGFVSRLGNYYLEKRISQYLAG